MTELWDQQREGQLTFAAYDGIGSVGGALKGYADRVLASSAIPEGDLERLFVQLVRPDELGDAVGHVRRDVKRLASSEELTTAQQELARRLARTRLVSVSGGDGGRFVVELAHEILIRETAQLPRWIDRSRGFRVWQERLRAAMRRWHAAPAAQRGRYLLQGNELSQALRRTRTHVGDILAAEARFVELSQQRRTRRRTAMAGVLGLVLAVLASSGLYGYAQFQRQRDDGDNVRLLAAAVSLRDTDPRASLQLGAQAERSGTAGSRSELLTTLIQNHYLARLSNHNTPIEAIAYGADGRIAVAEDNGVVWLWKLQDGHVHQLGTIAPEPSRIMSLAFSPDGRTLVTATQQRTLLWNIADPSRPSRIGEGLRTDIDHGGFDVAWTADGRMVGLAGSQTNQVELWDVRDPSRPAQVGSVRHPDFSRITHIALSGDGRTLVTAGEWQDVAVWNIANPAHPAVLGVLSTQADDVAITSTGNLIAVAAAEPSVRLFTVDDVEGLHQLAMMSDVTDRIRSLAFTSDGHTLAAGGVDNTVRLWNTATAELPASAAVLRAHTGKVNALQFSPDGNYLVSGDEHGLAMAWTTHTMSAPPRLGDQPEWPDGEGRVVFASDHKTLALFGFGAQIWTVAGRTVVRQVDVGGRDSIRDALFLPDRKTLVTDEYSRRYRLWNITQPGGGQPITLPAGRVGDAVLAVSHDGRMLATSAAGGGIAVWDIGDLRKPLFHIDTGQLGYLAAVAFTPDDRRIVAVDGKRTMAVWAIAAPARPMATMTGAPTPTETGVDAQSGEVPPYPFTSGALAADGRTLVIQSESGPTELWDLGGLGEPGLFAAIPGGQGSFVSVSADGSLAVVPTRSRHVQLWDLTNRSHPTLLAATGPNGAEVIIAFAPSGGLAAQSGGGDGLNIVDMSPLIDAIHNPVGAACHIAAPPMTEDEWRQFTNVPYRHVCG